MDVATQIENLILLEQAGATREEKQMLVENLVATIDKSGPTMPRKVLFKILDAFPE